MRERISTSISVVIDVILFKLNSRAKILEEQKHFRMCCKMFLSYTYGCLYTRKNPLKHLFLSFPATVDLLYQKAVANLKENQHTYFQTEHLKHL